MVIEQKTNRNPFGNQPKKILRTFKPKALT